MTKIKKAKTPLIRMYITKIKNKDKMIIGWDLKEAKNVNLQEFKTKKAAVNAFLKMNIDAKAYVLSTKTNIFEYTILSTLKKDATIEEIKTSKKVFQGTKEVDISALIGETKVSPKIAKTKVKAKKISKVKVTNEELIKTSKTKKISQSINFKPSIILPKEVFGLKAKEINKQAIFDTILSERASQRQGTHKTKNRVEIRGGGRKPWRQKGTGKARAGSNSSPIWVGGGRVFGPKPDHNYSLKVNKKVYKLAKLGAFSFLANNKAILVEDVSVKEISTKDFISKLEALQVNWLRHIVVVTDNLNVLKSAANLQNVYVRKLNSLSVELLTLADVLILSRTNIAILKTQFTKGVK